MCFDAVREGSSLWFLSAEESCAELPHTRHGVGGRSLRLEDLAPLFIWRAVRGVLKPQNSEVYFHAAAPQYEATYMDGFPRGL